MKTKKRLLALFIAILAICLGAFAMTSCKSCDPEQTDPGQTEVKLVSISMDTKPTKLVYEIGEEVDTSGMKVTAKYSDNTTEDVTLKCTTSMDGQKIKAETTSYFVKYTFKKVTKTVRVDIKVNKEDIAFSAIENDSEFKEPYLVAQESTADMVFITSVDSGTMQIDGVLELTGTVASGTFTYTERNDYLGEIADIDGNPKVAEDTGLPFSKKIAVMTGSYATSDGEMRLKTKTVSRMRTSRLDSATVQIANVVTDESGEVTGINFGSMVKDGKSSLFFGWGKANAAAFTESNAQNFGLDPYICYFSRVKEGKISSDIRIYHAPVESIEIEQAPIKTQYAPGEAVSTIGMSLRVNFVAGKSIVVTSGYALDKDVLETGDTAVTVSYHGYFAEEKTCTLEVTVQSAYEEGLYSLELLNKITDFSYTYGEYQTLTDVLKSSAMTVIAKYVEDDVPDKAVDEYTAVGYDGQGNVIEGNKITPDLKYYEVSYTEGGRTVKTGVNVGTLNLRTPYNVAEASDADYVFYASYKLAERKDNVNHDVVITMTEGESANAGTFLAQMYVTAKKGISITGTYTIEGDSVAFTSAEAVSLVGNSTMYKAVDETAEFVRNESGEIIGLDFGVMHGFFGLNYEKTVTDNSAESIGKPVGNACLVRIYNHNMGDLNTHYGNKVIVGTAIRFTVDGVDIENGKIEIMLGETLRLLAEFTPGDTTDQRVEWTFVGNDDGIVSFEYKEGYGVFKALKAGEITVTATSVKTPELAVTCTLKVSAIAVTGVTLDKTELSLNPDSESVTLTATVLPENATNKQVSWSSSNEEVATVLNGVVTPVAVGTAAITVTTADGGHTAICTVTVAPVAVTGVTLDKTELALNPASSPVALTATVLPENATNKQVSWSSSNEGVVTVLNGVVTVVGEGTATITVTTADGSKTATCAVTVTPVAVTGVTLNEQTVSILLDSGETKTLTATVAPENATNKQVSWSSSNEEVATVLNGVVTPVTTGTATITVTTADGGHTATCTVTVVTDAIAVTGVTLDKTELALNPASSPVALTATVLPENATNKQVSWSSSNEEVATVADGIVTVVGVGNATITVTTADGSKTATCAVTVTPVAVTGVTLDFEEVTVERGKTLTLTATVLPENATNKQVSWSSSNNDVATVADGVVTAIAAGTATITVTTADGSKTATCAVTVKVSATAISLNDSRLEIGKGQNVTLTVTYTPSDVTDKQVSWSSSNNDVATVADGVVTAVAAGTATITVTYALDGGKNITATCAVTVNSGLKSLAIEHQTKEFDFSLTPYEVLYGKSAKAAFTDAGLKVIARYWDADKQDADVTQSAVFEARDAEDKVLGDKLNCDVHSCIVSYTEGEGAQAVTKSYRIGDPERAGDGTVAAKTLKPYEAAATSAADLALYSWFHRQSNTADVSIELFYKTKENVKDGGTFILQVYLGAKKIFIIEGAFTVGDNNAVTFSYTAGDKKYTNSGSAFISATEFTETATIVYADDGVTVAMLDFGVLGTNDGFFDAGNKNWTNDKCKTDETHPNGSIGETIGDKAANHVYAVVLQGYTGTVRSNYSEIPQAAPVEA